MSEHENGNFVLKCGQNQQKHQPFMAISDFALLYRIRRSRAHDSAAFIYKFTPAVIIFLTEIVSARFVFGYAGITLGFLWQKKSRA